MTVDGLKLFVGRAGRELSDEHRRIFWTLIEASDPALKSQLSEVRLNRLLAQGPEGLCMALAIVVSLTNLNSSLASLESTVATIQVPVGAILIWSGATSAVPNGWQLCDGTNSAPDLRNRFVIGAGSTYSVATTGGAASYSISGSSPSISTGTANNVCQATMNDEGNTNACSYNGNLLTAVTSVSASGGGSSQTVGLPPYYALAYIIKT